MAIRVLVVDDSLFMRTLIADLLNADPDVEVVGRAKSGLEALKVIPKLKPDVVTLDLAMPGLDGLTTLERIMAEQATPVIILSAHARSDAALTIRCLGAGAIGCVLKPSGELSLDIGTVRAQLLEAVKAAATVNNEALKALALRKPERPRRRGLGTKQVFIVGSSTGGAQTLEAILPLLPADFPAPVIVAQHAPSPWFTEAFAARLNQHCELTVKVAEDAEVIRAATVYLVPNGCRMTLQRQGSTQVSIGLSPGDSQELSPSIDDAMQSVAQVYREGAVGIIVSGMGRDGVLGMKAIKEAGGTTIAQDSSALIFGMPKTVIEAGLADQVLSASGIADAMLQMVSSEVGSAR